MITDIEMNAVWKLEELCQDSVSKKIVDKVADMLGSLDSDGFASKDDEAEFLVDYAEDINGVVRDAIADGEFQRKIGEYTVLCSFPYGDKEIFLGENAKTENPVERYVVGDCVSNELFVRYENCIAGDNYNEIVEMYGQRVNEQIQSVKDELDKFPYDRTPVGKESCDPIAGVNLEGEIIVINPNAIMPEYVGANEQICVATGGFGCSPEGAGRKVYCKNVFTGEEYAWSRGNVLGILKPECVPEWVKERITDKPIEVLFTFGSSESFPYQMGYVSITAPSVKEAIAEFRRHWPDRSENCLNCSDYYYTEDSKAQIKEHQNGAGCHKAIDITISPKMVSVESRIAKAAQTCENVNKDAVAKSDMEMGKE